MFIFLSGCCCNLFRFWIFHLTIMYLGNTIYMGIPINCRCCCWIARHYSAELQTTKQALTTSKKLNWIYLQWLSLPFKGERDNLALIIRRWKCKKVERLTITANSFTKIDRLDGFRPLCRSGWENSTRSRNQSDCRICWIPPAHELRRR